MPESDAFTRRYTGFVTVRMDDRGNPEREGNSLYLYAEEFHLTGLMKLLERYELRGQTSRLIRSRSIKEIDHLEDHENFTPKSSLKQYWRIDLRAAPGRIEAFLEELRAQDGVQHAYRDLETTVGSTDTADVSDYSDLQGYLQGNEVGVNALGAWTESPLGSETGVGFADIEFGWIADPGLGIFHEEYDAKSPKLVYPDTDSPSLYHRNHGAAVLGVVLATHDQHGVKGLAPSADPVLLSSAWQPDSSSSTNDASGSNAADAISAVIPLLEPGSVLLIELQRSFLPTEVDEADYNAICLAVAHNIIVIEIAGNGNWNLDNCVELKQPGNPGESGAIVVGAARSWAPHERLGISNWGSRVDCYAWGNNVVTCGYGDLDNGEGWPTGTYTKAFHGTSSAGAIIAGSALFLQSVYKAAHPGGYINPTDMRDYLSDPDTGTKQGGTYQLAAGIPPEPIGVMPDLQKIIYRRIYTVPNVYLRDDIGDDGSVPSTGNISASPDIIVRRSPVLNAGQFFGESGGLQDSTDLCEEVVAGEDHHVYVRCRNKGGEDAVGVRARIFWSEVSTLVTPDMWNEIAISAPFDVPQGDTLTVSGAVTWAAGAIPAPGHYCFIGLLDHPADPAPALSDLQEWDQFCNFIRASNKISWRNFNVIHLSPGTQTFATPLFLLSGAHGKNLDFDYVIVRQLPKGVKTWLEVPDAISKQMAQDACVKSLQGAGKGRTSMELATAPKISFPSIPLSAGKGHKVRFQFDTGGTKIQEGNRVEIRQYYGQQEVGRVTWVLKTIGGNAVNS